MRLTGPRSSSSPLATPLRALAILLVATLSASCGREPTRSAASSAVKVSIPFANQASQTADPEDVTRVSFTLYTTTGGVRKELRTFVFDLSDDNNLPRGVSENDATGEITFTLEFPLITDASYAVEGSASNAAGVLLYQLPSLSFTEKQVASNSGSVTVTGSATYVGPGASARRLTVLPGSATLKPGDSFTFTATAFDANNGAVANAPIRWASSNPSIVSFANDRVGTVVAGNVAGTATITARVEELAISATATATVQLTPSGIVLVAGGGQTALAGAQLASPVRVRVVSGQVPVPNVVLTFTPASGSGSVSPATATTNAQGEAETRWTLGPTAGNQTLTVSASGLSSLAVTATATAVPKTVSFVSLTPSAIGPGETSTVLVHVRDANNANISGETVTFTASGGTFSSGTAATNSSGRASVTYTASSTPGSYTITASITGSSAQTSITVAANQSNVATQMVKISGDNQQIRAGQTSANPIMVEVRNASGSPVAGAFVDFFGNSGASRVVTGSDGRAFAFLSVSPGAATGSGTVVVQLFPNTAISVSFTYVVIP